MAARDFAISKPCSGPATLQAIIARRDVTPLGRSAQCLRGKQEKDESYNVMLCQAGAEQGLCLETAGKAHSCLPFQYLHETQVLHLL